MEIIEKLNGNNKQQKIVIQVRDVTFDFTQYTTHIIITDYDEEILNIYAETLIASNNQKNKYSLEIPVCGNYISVKIEKNYSQSLTIGIEDI